MKQSETRNLTMMMDLYEMTMANGYFNDQDKDTRVALMYFTAVIRMVADLQFLQD
mgnify:CR=1 FL=1